ncbi:MAG: hypothetical protein Ct9H300mP28_05520 [Pseudomonadota bacterium]|nr:MAG: hypothetical protein Ct9H300mP28_05520 [Pseudomonadota bacterium]
MVFCNQEEAFTLLDTEITQQAVKLCLIGQKQSFNYRSIGALFHIGRNLLY